MEPPPPASRPGPRLAAAGLLALTALLLAAGRIDEAVGGARRDGPTPDDAAATPPALHTLPDAAPIGGLALPGHLFLKRAQQRPFAVEHERIHLRQQAARPVWFWVSYLLLPRWRLRWEAEAYAAQARAGCPIDGPHGTAAYLSGPAYLWAGSQAVAAAEVRRFLAAPSPLTSGE